MTWRRWPTTTRTASSHASTIFCAAAQPAPTSWTSSWHSACPPRHETPVLQLRSCARGTSPELFVSFQGEGLFSPAAGISSCVCLVATSRCRYCDTPGSLERCCELCRVRARSTGIFGIESADGRRRPLTREACARGGEGAGRNGDHRRRAAAASRLSGGAARRRPAGRARACWRRAVLQPDKLSIVLPFVDAVSMDIKLPSNTGEPPFWDAHAHFLAAAGDKAYVKILVDDATLLAEVERAAEIRQRHRPAAAGFLFSRLRPNRAMMSAPVALATLLHHPSASASQTSECSRRRTRCSAFCNGLCRSGCSDTQFRLE